MTNQSTSMNKTLAEIAPTRPAEGTIRIEHDRKRLALAALASGLAALVVPGVFIVGHLHPARIAPEWTFAPLCVAVLIAAAERTSSARLSVSRGRRFADSSRAATSSSVSSCFR